MFANRQYPITINNTTICLGDSQKSIKSKYGNKYSGYEDFAVIKDGSYVALKFDESDKLSEVVVDDASKAEICNIQLNEAAVDVFDSLGIDDFNMDEYTDCVLITFDKGKATEAYNIEEDSTSDFQIQKIIKNSEAVLVLKFDELKVTDMSLSYSRYMLDSM